MIGEKVKQDANLVPLFDAIKTSCFLLKLNVFSTLSAENWRLLVDCLRNNSSIETLRVIRQVQVTREQGHELVQALSSNEVITEVILPPNSLSAEDQNQVLRITSLNKYRPLLNANLELQDAQVRMKRLQLGLIAFKDEPWLLHFILQNNVDVLEQYIVVRQGGKRKRKQPDWYKPGKW